MNNYEFLLTLGDHLELYILNLLFSIFIYYFIFRKYVLNILDPLFIALLGSAIGFATVNFLFWCDLIKPFYFFSYILTQTSYILSFCFYARRKRLKKTKIVTSTDNDRSLLGVYVLIACLDCLLQFVVYKMEGIPLFKESRLETFIGGSGFGLINRFITVLRFIAIYLSFYFWNKNYRFIKKYIILYFVCVLLFAILSGSKSGVLAIVSYYICYLIANHKVQSLSLNTKYLFAGIIVMTILGLYIKYDSVSLACYMLLERVVFYGDVYWQSYPNDMIYAVAPEGNWFTALFADFLGAFRFVTWDDLPDPLGRYLFSALNQSDLVMGCNPRHNVFGLYYMGPYFSPLFSACIGGLLGRVYNRLYHMPEKNSVWIKIAWVYMYICLLSAEVDPVMCISFVSSFLMTMPIVLILIILALYITKRGNIDNYSELQH